MLRCTEPSFFFGVPEPGTSSRERKAEDHRVGKGKGIPEQHQRRPSRNTHTTASSQHLGAKLHLRPALNASLQTMVLRFGFADTARRVSKSKFERGMIPLSAVAVPNPPPKTAYAAGDGYVTTALSMVQCAASIAHDEKQ